MTMKELRAILKAMGVEEERRGNVFIFRKESQAKYTTVKSRKELGRIWFYEKESRHGEDVYTSTTPEKVIEYFK